VERFKAIDWLGLMPDIDRAERINLFNAQSESWPSPTRCDVTLEFLSPILRGALGVWREKAGDNPWPSRADMTPRAMKKFLPHVAIIEIVNSPSKTRYRLRLTGTWVDERKILGRAGNFLDELIPGPQVDRFQSLLALALSIGPVRTFTRGIKWRDKEHLDAEDFFAPLGNPGEPANAILAVFTSRPRAT
jgi:hypothetical protein